MNEEAPARNLYVRRQWIDAVDNPTLGEAMMGRATLTELSEMSDMTWRRLYVGTRRTYS